MREVFVSDKVSTVCEGKTVTVERRYSGTIDEKGAFHLRSYLGKRRISGKPDFADSALEIKKRSKPDTAA